MSEYRDAYLKVREILADELKEKYNFIPIHNTSRCLMLKNEIATIHITFDTPDGDDIHITDSKTPDLNDSFMGLVIRKYPDLDDMKRKYDDDCVAIMVVHYAGHPVPMDELMPWAKEMNLKVIEDCAHTTGSLYKGKSLGTWGDIGCYSFEEKKLMTTGDGGMIVSNNPDLTGEELREFCRNELTAYKVPKFVEFRAELPKSNVGKILRRELRDQ